MTARFIPPAKFGPGGETLRFNAVGSHIFAGGFTLGVKKHFKVLAHLEISNYGVATMRQNQPEIPVHEDIASWPLEELLKAGVDFYYGNPPCAAWSSAGYSATAGADKWLTDPRVDITRQHFGMIEKLRPSVWAWESVTQAFTKGRPFVDELTEGALKLGYAVTYLLHDVKWLGVPQSRKRFFMVCHRYAIPWPKLNWAPPTTSLEALAEIKPIGPPYTGGKSSLTDIPLDKVLPGERLRNAWEREICPPEKQRLNAKGQIAGRPSFGHVRLRPDTPSGVMMGYAIVHPTEDRFLHINEYAHMAGFPEGYEFTPVGDAGRLIGRGVCPPVGEWLARAVRAGLEERTRIKPGIHQLDLRFSPEEADAKGHTRTAASRFDRSAKDTMMKIAKPTKKEEGSGSYIRGQLLLGQTDYEGLAASVRTHWAGRKTTIKDIYWNHQKLIKDGLYPPRWTGSGQVRRDMPKKNKNLPCDKPPVAQVAAACRGEKQKPRTRKNKVERDEDRQFDKTSLAHTSYYNRHNRDYGAHFFRWGFVTRDIIAGKRVLDVGCGVSYAVVKLTDTIGGTLCPSKYVGVDLNVLTKPPQRKWSEFKGEFDFTKRYKELGRFDVALCLEVIEHMQPEDGRLLLEGIHDRLVGGGHLYLSTPVFDGYRAANHLHEYEILELAELVREVGFTVEQRFGTFGKLAALRKAATVEENALMDRLGRYYNNNVLSCFLAPLYPDASRNNLWVLKKGK